MRFSRSGAGRRRHFLGKKIALMRSVFQREEHATGAARVDDEWLNLNSRTFMLVRDTNLASAVPAFVLDQASARRFVSKNRAHGTTTGWAS